MPTSGPVAPIQPIEPPKVAQIFTPAPIAKPLPKHKRRSRHDKQTPSSGAVAQVATAKVPEPQPEPISKIASTAKTADLPEVSNPQAKPAATVVPAKPAIAKVKLINHQTYANALSRGLNQARIDGKIRYGSSKWYSVNGAIRILRRGGSLSRAIAVSGTKPDEFKRLLRDGGLVV